MAGVSAQAAKKTSFKDKITNFGKKLIHSEHMLWGIGLASFLESLIVPIPLETILIPLMQARRDRIILISAIALLGCMLGASLGYALGYFIFDAIGEQLISLVSTEAQFEQVRQQMENKGFWFVFSVGVTPVPFQVAMLAAGATQFSFVLFIVASTLSRSIRYFGLAALVWFAGNRAQKLFEKHKLTASILLVVIVALVWGLSFF